MKKIIAIMMALVMMMAIAVPAFAATLDTAAQAGDATVLTDTSAIVGDGTYTVTYPATMALTWGVESTGFQYSVTSQLKTGKCVSVAMNSSSSSFTISGVGKRPVFRPLTYLRCILLMKISASFLSIWGATPT